MKIAHIVPHSVTFPLKTHNGRYDWVLQLAKLQVRAGHEVTIYCNPSSHGEGLFFEGIVQASENKKQNNINTFRLAFSRDHDIYHSHFDDLHYEVAHETQKPIVFTQHWWPKESLLQSTRTIEAPNVWAVPPTRYMYDFDVASGIQTKGFIHHGIDLSVFKGANTEPSGRLLFVGRISPEKNLETALEAARKAGVGLDIVGKIAPKNVPYWQSLRHLIERGDVRYLGEKTQAELIELYSSALAVLAPFAATEAFGLVAIEAQACGAPVIMLAGGSRGELVHDGKTGFLCKTMEEFTSAINDAHTLKPEDCIAFARTFNVHAMVQKYEQLYLELVD